MPKLKTHSGAKKRFNLTKTGKADVTVEDIVKKMIPYK